MKQIKIVTFGNFPFGGASANFLRNLSFYLSLKGDKVEVILPTGNYYGKNDKKIKNKRNIINEITYHYVFQKNHPNNYLGKFIGRFLGQVLLFLEILILKIRRKVDLLIVYNITYTQSLYFLVLKKLLSIEIIYILPEMYEKPKGKLPSMATIKWYNFYFGINGFLNQFNGYIVLSTYLRDFVKSRVKENMPIEILPNIIEPEFYQLQNVTPFIEGKITVGYCGTPTRKDGINDLLHSFSILLTSYSNIHLLIIGDITNGSSIIPKLKAMAKEYKIENHVTFTGLVSQYEIPYLLNSCQILALTRPSGIFAIAGFPTKLGEYFACKKPVLITKVGDIGYYFKDEENAIIVEPDNVESIVSGFSKLLNSQELMNKIALSGFDWMNKNLNYKNLELKIFKN
jgi:glycosyltransferase involved in cell wall biosynthesis